MEVLFRADETYQIVNWCIHTRNYTCSSISMSEDSPRTAYGKDILLKLFKTKMYNAFTRSNDTPFLSTDKIEMVPIDEAEVLRVRYLRFEIDFFATPSSKTFSATQPFLRRFRSPTEVSITSDVFNSCTEMTPFCLLNLSSERLGRRCNTTMGTMVSGTPCKLPNGTGLVSRAC